MNELLIEAGDSKTFVLYADLTFVEENDSISTQLVEDATLVGPGTSASLIAANNIVWADESSSAADDFFNGYLLEVDKTVTTINLLLSVYDLRFVDISAHTKVFIHLMNE